MKTRRSDSAFTLIELLAVVAVILLLLSLLVPGLKSAKDRASLVPCQSNLRQLYSLCVNFAGENNGELPNGLSENPGQLSARTNYTNFDLVNKYMRSAGYPPSVWYCPSYPTVDVIEQAWGDNTWYNSGKQNATGTPGEFPIGYFYTANPTQPSIHKFKETPPRTLNDLTQTNGAIARDYCVAPRPSPVQADQVPVWRWFPHYSDVQPAVCQYMMADGSAVRKKINEMRHRYSYYAPSEVYW